jgi:transcriptional regulator with XRE-family HTH domain
MTMFQRYRPSPGGSTITVVVEWPDDIGDRIRVARTGAKLSREKLAEQTDIGYDRLGIIERGEKRPRKPEVWAIARVTRTPETFFEGGSLTLPAPGETITIPATTLTKDQVGEVLVGFLKAVGRAFEQLRPLIPDQAAADEALAAMRAQMNELHQAGLEAEAPSTSSSGDAPKDRPNRASKR